jgi:hypothetical protein
MNDSFGFFACMQIAFDQHLDVAGHRTMFVGGNPFDPFGYVRVEANSNAGAVWC